MPQQTPIKSKTPTLRIFLGLTVAWSILQCALIFTIYKFHLFGSTAYLAGLVPLLPVLAMIALAARKRASEPDTYLRLFYLGNILFATLFLPFSPLMVWLETYFQSEDRLTPGLAALLAGFALPIGILVAVVLLLPRRMAEGSLFDQLTPLRVKLATPTLRRITRMGVLALVYVTVNFASRMLFNAYAPKGALAYAIALLPVLPIFGLVPIYTKYMAEEQDEFQRHLFHQSILWALLGTLVLASVLGRLEDRALILQRIPNFFRPYSIVPLFYFLQIEAGYGIAAIQAMRMKKNR